MAFASLGSAGTAIVKLAGADWTISPTRTLNVGEIAVVHIAWDVESGPIGDTDYLSCSDDAGNTWTKVGETQNRFGSLNGALAALFVSQLTAQLTTASVVTVLYTGLNESLPTAKAGVIRSFSIGSGKTWELAAVNTARASATSIGVTTPASGVLPDARERLWLASFASETAVTTGNFDPDYPTGQTTTIQTTGGSDGTNMRQRGAWRIASIDTDGFTGQTGATATDHAVILATLNEIDAPVGEGGKPHHYYARGRAA